MEITGGVIQEGDLHSRITALCMMAYVVSRYPEGPLQELAEDMLASYIAEARVTPEDVAVIRHFRMAELQDASEH
ncbi:hypothetical protein IAI58_09070 [Roseomonas marmotae]|uniref:Uncharacterized protein n=2 Tax=Roseomonas marmotae TaxID=2768161 RepID=A0ABS3KFH3_9PROT|nr:hypothetical protein [Roseomonas marmotae]MBO1076224.1 hypothetical protein [Roseomonas marmotae]QTI77891.1 hypothetical protein IAI58_09070 [Roseomonas marmotae]